jgi:hypothetical protein
MALEWQFGAVILRLENTSLWGEVIAGSYLAQKEWRLVREGGFVLQQKVVFLIIAVRSLFFSYMFDSC